MKRSFIAVLILAFSVAAMVFGEETRKITYQEYFDKVYGGWLGKISGLTLGVPKEFSEPWPPSEITYFADVPDRFSDLYSGDDLYFPLLAQLCLKKYGLHPTQGQYMQEWSARLFTGRIWGANRIALEHYRAGIMPPKTGWPGYNGGHDIDAQIGLDTMGWVCPGLINTAAEMTDIGAHLMCWGDGADGAVFVTALLSEAFFASDLETLIRKAQSVLPAGSLYSEMVDDVLRWRREQPDWRMTRQLLARRYSQEKKLNDIAAVINGGAVLVGLLYGEKDFGRTAIIAMQCRWDSDCNASTAAGILGTVLGASHIEPRWVQIFKDTYENYCLRDLPRRMRISDIARESVEIGEKVIVENGGSVAGSGENRVFFVPEQTPARLAQQEVFSAELIARNEQEMEAYYRDKLKSATAGWNPQWQMLMASFENPPEVLPVYMGRSNVLKAQPGFRGVILERALTLAPGKNHYLRVGVAHHPNILNEQTGRPEIGKWLLEVQADGQKIGEYSVFTQGGLVVWEDPQFDLSALAGKPVKIRLIGWSNMTDTEFFGASQTTYWSEIELISRDQPEPWR
jgi:hypothetical protein